MFTITQKTFWPFSLKLSPSPMYTLSASLTLNNRPHQGHYARETAEVRGGRERQYDKLWQSRAERSTVKLCGQPDFIGEAQKRGSAVIKAGQS